jgi:hypothetical protein
MDNSLYKGLDHIYWWKFKQALSATASGTQDLYTESAFKHVLPSISATGVTNNMDQT